MPQLTTFAAKHAEALNEVAPGWGRIEVEACELRPEDCGDRHLDVSRRP
ncbi:hypothetical protein [Actinoplanes sp. NPDC049599]